MATLQTRGRLDPVKIPAIKLSIRIGPDSTRAEVMREVDRLGKMMNTYLATGKRIGLLLGHVMALVKDRELYKPEHATFEDYRLAIADKYGLSRTTVSLDLQIARALPRVTPEQARKIPTTNLVLVARASKNASDSKLASLLVQAEKSSIVEFRRSMEKRGLITQRLHPGLVKLVLRVTKATRKDWHKFRGDRSDEQALSAIVMPARPAKRMINARAVH